MNKSHYNVLGLMNTESKTKIKNALDKVEGVQKVNIDAARGTIEVGYNLPADEFKIMQCIENTGYPINP